MSLFHGKRHFSDSVPVGGKQWEYAFDQIGNRESTRNSRGQNSITATYTANSVNQYTQRSVPGEIFATGTASNQATVTVREGTNTAHLAGRHDDYWWHAVDVVNALAIFSTTNLQIRAYITSGTNSLVKTEVREAIVPETPENFAYDSDGNLLSSGLWTNTWDANNRLIRVESRSGVPDSKKVRVNFTYDHQGRRTTKAVSTGYSGGSYSSTNVTTFVYNGWLPIAEIGNGFTNFMTWGLDLSGTLQGAGGIGGLLSRSTFNASTTSTVFYAFDGNGNVVNLIDASDGSVAAEYEYSPFGGTIKATGTEATNNPFRFSTKYTDEETGLLNYGYRFLDPELGRFLNRDPLEEEGSLGLHVFVLNAPVNFIDALGLATIPSRPTAPATTASEDREARRLLNLIYTALRSSGSRPVTALLLNNYLGGGGNVSLPNWVVDEIEGSASFQNQRAAVLAAIVRANGPGDIAHMDSGFPRNARFRAGEGDLFSAFHDLQFAVGLRGCIAGSGSRLTYQGALFTKYHDWWGFSLYDMSGRYVGGRVPFAFALRSFCHRHPRLCQPFGRWINMQEYRFVALQSRGLVQAFDINGRRYEPNVTINVSGSSAIVTPISPSGGRSSP